ncbi:phosphoprotein [Ninove microtus virus]|uniref:Phosphoprotein n=1 Tax=Ninove microtus virus TaxID=2940990 RepID=A0AAE9HTQ5_9MONO|nr:phosphoprotein [Ninove microtus virus]
MAEYTTSELNQLVSDGIKTIEFIQQAAKNPKETYGRSAIQKPATRDRIKAWEGIAGEHDYSGGKPDDEKRGGEGVKEEEGKGNHQVARRSRRRKRGTPVKIESSSEVSDRENGDGENSPTGDSTVGRPPDTGLPGTGEKGDSGSGGDTKHERSIGDDSVSNEDFRVVLSADHESSALETTGSSPAVSNVREATTEDFAQIFDEGPSKIHRRLTGIAAYAGSSQPKGSADHPVKKGIDGNTVSTPLVDVPSSENGAIPNVHPSLLRQPSSHAHAENAPEGVSSVSTTGSTWQSCETPSHNPDIEGKIDLIINTLDGITRKLDMLPEIKEEIKNINKKITTLSLGLSVVENYIKSMMIIIPSSGKNQNEEYPEINPDLKPVIGRDNTRGLDEVTLKRGNLEDLNEEQEPPLKDQQPKQDTEGPNRSGKESANSGKPKRTPRTIDDKHIIKPLNFDESNAANFKPKNDFASYMTIVAMIRNEIDDISVRESLIKWVDTNIAATGAEEVYNIIRESLDKMNSEGLE